MFRLGNPDWGQVEGSDNQQVQAVSNHCKWRTISMYREVSNISRTLVGNKNVDHSDVFGSSPVGAALTTSSFST